jgi:RND family efflux transporter MFP subunit
MNRVVSLAVSTLPRALLAASLVPLLMWGVGAVSAEEETKKVETEVAVAVAQIARMSLSTHVAAYGVVEPAPGEAGVAPAGGRLSAPTTGVVTATPGYEGQQAKKGDLLVQLDPRAADAAVLKAQSAATLAEKVLARQKDLQKMEGTSDKILQQAEAEYAAAQNELAAARALRSLLSVTAPFAGTVMRVNVRPGEIADPATPLVEMFAPERLVVAAGVPAAEAKALKRGRPVAISSTADSSVDGKLVFVSPQVDVKTGAVPVRASIPAGAGLRPGQFVRLNIATEEHNDILAIPVESLVRDSELGYVVAFVDGKVARKKPVRVILRDGDWVEVEGEDVKVGATVVTDGAYGLPKETKIRIITPDD